MSKSIGNGEIPKTNSIASASGDRKEIGTTQKVDKNTKFTDSVGLVDETEPKGMLLVPFNPYSRIGVEGSILRSYKLATFTWDVTHPVGELLYQADLPEALLSAIPTLIAKLEGSVLMRSKIHLMFTVNCTNMEEGMLMISWAPASAVATHRTESSGGVEYVFANSFRNPILMSASEGQSVGFELPWLYPYMYRDITSDFGFANGFVVALVMHPLVSTSPNPPADVTITVYAKLVDPDIAGLDPTAGVGSRKMVGVGQSAISSEQREKSVTGLVAGVPLEQSDPAPSGIMSVVSDVEQIVGVASTVLSMTGGSAPIELSNTTVNEATASTVEARTKRPGTALAMSRDCLITKSVGIVSFDNPNGLLSEVCSIPSLIRLGAITNADFAPKQLILSIVNRPSGGLVNRPPSSYGVIPTYAMHYMLHTTYWRGTMRYLFIFQCAKNVTARVRIVWSIGSLPDPIGDEMTGDIVSAVIDVSGDTKFPFSVPWLSRQWYLSSQAGIPGVSEPAGNGNIGLYLESIIGSMDTTNDPPIYYSVWQSAGPDFDLAMQRAPDLTATLSSIPYVVSRTFDSLSLDDPVTCAEQENIWKKTPLWFEEGKGECDVRTFFSNEKFDGLIPASPKPIFNVLFNERINSVTDMMRRPEPKKFAATSGGPFTETFDPFPTSPITGPIVTVQQQLASPFLCQRGSIMMALVDLAPTTFVGIGLIPTTGMSAFSNAFQVLRQQIEWVLRPWNEPVLWINTMHEDFNSENACSVTYNANQAVLTSVGDDFCLGSPTTPPYLNFVNTGDLQRACANCSSLKMEHQNPKSIKTKVSSSLKKKIES